MRFCIVSTFYPPFNFGGDGIYAHRLANGLARLGHAVTVLHSPSAYEMAAHRKPSRGYDDHPNVHVRPVPTPLGALGLLAVQQTGHPCLQSPAIRRHLDEGEYDVIHYNNVSLLGGPAIFRRGRGLKLCTLIEHWLVCPMHVLWKYDREVCTKPTCLRCTLHGRRPPQLWRYTGLMRRATRSIDAFIGPSLFTMNMHKERGLRGRMVQLPLFHPRPSAVPPLPAEAAANERPFCLFVGRLEKIKGVQDLIDAYRELPELDLLVAGTGTYEPTLRERAAGMPNVKFVGRLDHPELQMLYGRAVANLVPSRCYETFGIIVAESFSAGTPVIVRAQSSLKEIVERHGGGLTFSTQEELRAAILRLWREPDLRAQLARQGRAAYESEFDEGPFLTHYLGVVNALLDEKRRTVRGGMRRDNTLATSQSVAGRAVVTA